MKKTFSLLLAIMMLLLVPFSAQAEPTTTKIEQSTTKAELTVEQRAEEILAKMTLREKITQMMLIYMPNKEATRKQKENQFGGYVLFAKNFREYTKEEKTKQIAGYQKVSKIKMIMAVDEEGGVVNRVSMYKAFRSSPFKSPRALYSSGGYKKVKSDTKEKAELLQSIGLNANLAPVADVAYSRSNYIYSRSFSTDAASTSKYIKTVVKEMKKDNMISTLKHFPGYGNNGNTHTDMIRDKRSMKTFETRDLLPFQAGIDAGCDMIMVSHNIVYAFDKKNPASLSKNVHKYIRDEMGFEGVIVSDGLGMAGVLDFVDGDKGEAFVRAILAGNDMVCSGAYKAPIESMTNAVKEGRISQKQIDASVKRILIMKLNHGIIK